MTTKYDAFFMDKFMKSLFLKKHKWQIFWMKVMIARVKQIYGKEFTLENLENYMFDIVARYRYCPDNVKIVRAVIQKLVEEV